MAERTGAPPDTVNPDHPVEHDEAPGFTWDQLLYRLYGDDDELLYIGRTNNIANRFKQHAKAQPWWHEVRRSSVETLPSFAELCEAEKDAIVSERPRYNVVYSTVPARRASLGAEVEPWRGRSYRLDKASDMLHERECLRRYWPEEIDEPTCGGCGAQAWAVLAVADIAAGHLDIGLYEARIYLPSREMEDYAAWLEASVADP